MAGCGPTARTIPIRPYLNLSRWRFQLVSGELRQLPPSDFLPDNAEGTIRCRERLGGLLKYYDRKAA